MSTRRVGRPRPVDRRLELMGADRRSAPSRPPAPRTRPSAGASRAAPRRSPPAAGRRRRRPSAVTALATWTSQSAAQAFDDVRSRFRRPGSARRRRRRSPCRRRATKRATARAAISEVNSSPKVPPGVTRSQRKGSWGWKRRVSTDHPAGRRVVLHPADGGAAVLLDPEVADEEDGRRRRRRSGVAEHEGAFAGVLGGAVDAAGEEVADRMWALAQSPVPRMLYGTKAR